MKNTSMMKISHSNKQNRFSDYDYSERLCREETVAHLLDIAARNKLPTVGYWKKMRAYYDGDHEISAHNNAFAGEQDIPWEAAQSTDGFIHVESQIDTALPDFEFSPRAADDYERAKQREKITRFICDINYLEQKNAVNERRLNILGSAVYKVCWDSSLFDGRNSGEVIIDAPKPEQIFTDPASSTVDGCEYIGYVYRLHKQKAKRIFEKDFKNLGEDISDYIDSYRNGRYYEYTGDERNSGEIGDDTITVPNGGSDSRQTELRLSKARLAANRSMSDTAGKQVILRFVFCWESARSDISQNTGRTLYAICSPLSFIQRFPARTVSGERVSLKLSFLLSMLPTENCLSPR